MGDSLIQQLTRTDIHVAPPGVNGSIIIWLCQVGAGDLTGLSPQWNRTFGRSGWFHNFGTRRATAIAITIWIAKVNKQVLRATFRGIRDGVRELLVRVDALVRKSHETRHESEG
jgi:hypothetical protein